MVDDPMVGWPDQSPKFQLDRSVRRDTEIAPDRPEIAPDRGKFCA